MDYPADWVRRMETRTTGYKRPGEPPDVVGELVERELPNKNGPFREKSEYIVTMTMGIRFLAYPDSPSELASKERDARQRLYQLLTSEFLDQARAVSLALFEYRAMGTAVPCKELNELQYRVDQLCNMLLPGNVQ